MKSGVKLILKPLLLSVVLAVGFVALHFGWFGDVTEESLLAGLFAQHWMVAWPTFILGSIIYTALGGPRQVLAFSCGYLLGGFVGGVVSALLTAAGAWLAIVVVRQVGMDWVMRKHGEKVERVREVLADDTWLWVCIVRLMPVGSNLATNVAAALAGLRTPSVLWGSLLGYLPQSLLFGYAGAGIALHDSSQIYISLALLVGSSLLALYLYHNGFKQRMGALRGPRADV